MVRNHETHKTLEVLQRHLDNYAADTKNIQILALTGTNAAIDLTPQEKTIVKPLSGRPHTIDELINRTGVLFEHGRQLKRLEDSYLVQRCDLTPTAVQHVSGEFDRWRVESARKIVEMLADLTNMAVQELLQNLLDMVVELLTGEILKCQISEETDPESLATDPVCRALFRNMLRGGNEQYAVRVELKRPIIGIGAPIHYFLPKVAERIKVETLLPVNADAANAIGAITSNVMVKKQLRINPSQEGVFLIDGLAGARHFGKFEDADRFARKEITRLVRKQALAEGTGSREVELKTDDKMAHTANGQTIFMGRSIYATIVGQPDAMVSAENCG